MRHMKSKEMESKLLVGSFTSIRFPRATRPSLPWTRDLIHEVIAPTIHPIGIHFESNLFHYLSLHAA